MGKLLLLPHKCDIFDYSVAALIQRLAAQEDEHFVSGFLCGYLEHLMRDQVTNAEIQRCCVEIVRGLYSEGENSCISTAALDKMRLFEAYCKLASDKREVVRTEACAVLPVISKRLCGEAKNRAVVSIYSSFLSDESRRVQEEAKCQLGKMIYSFHPHPIPASFALLMEELVSAAGAGNGHDSSRMRILESLAFSFPAIVTAYLSGGSPAAQQEQPPMDSWAFLNSLLKRLARIVNISIAKTLAFGLHEIAALVGQSRAENDIFPLLVQFLRDHEVIRLGAIESMFNSSRTTTTKNNNLKQSKPTKNSQTPTLSPSSNATTLQCCVQKEHSSVPLNVKCPLTWNTTKLSNLSPQSLANWNSKCQKPIHSLATPIN
jgi:serine/threonine-protein phosphatase 4 regulatory subunit 1